MSQLLPLGPVGDRGARAHSYVERADDNTAGSTDAQRIINEAKDRFQHAAKWEYVSRQYFLDDWKFAHADAYNGYQWPNDIRRNRDVEERPCLTINKVRKHNDLIINEIVENLPEARVWAVGNGATAESAEILKALMRQIASRSNANVAYATSVKFAVDAGIGYVGLATRYVDEDSFDQEIIIERREDPLQIYLDPEAKEFDKSDSNFGFEFQDILKEEFDSLYPKWKEIASGQNTIDDEHGWYRADYIRVCKYWRRVQRDDILFAYVDPQSGATVNIRESVLKRGGAGLLDYVRSSPNVRERPTKTDQIEWHLIIGTKLVESGDWPGKYIPLFPNIGEEFVVEGIMDRRGHTRAQIDPQRMYNYMSSASVEVLALQSKSPWVAPAEAIEGYESYWNTANKINHSLLPYNAIADDGTIIPPPQRTEPPVAAPGIIQAMQIAQNELSMVTGQYQDSFGERSNERSAKAINERIEQGDKSSSHFRTNTAICVRAVARAIVDLIPHIYDTPRILQAFAEDGSDFQLELDPRAAQAHQAKLAHDGKVAAHVLNPTVGMYEVQADTGPSWGTRREEAFNALALILTQAPQLTSIIGDLLLQSSDFDKASEAAARLRRMVPPHALGEGPSMAEQQLTAQVQQLQQLLQRSLQQLAENAIRIKGHAEKRDIDVANALTAQLKALLDYRVKVGQPVNPGEIDALIEQAAGEALRVNPRLEGIIADNVPDLGDNVGNAIGPTAGAGLPRAVLPRAATEQVPPLRGARQGPDGHWYVRNYNGSGQYSRVM